MYVLYIWKKYPIADNPEQLQQMLHMLVLEAAPTMSNHQHLHPQPQLHSHWRSSRSPSTIGRSIPIIVQHSWGWCCQKPFCTAAEVQQGMDRCLGLGPEQVD
jgi:hypothetical protein